VSIHAILQQHIAACHRINQDAIDFSRKVSETHVEVVERKIIPELRVGEKVDTKDEPGTQ
jgi:hypothetical protein